jgi:hypothetical protein
VLDVSVLDVSVLDMTFSFWGWLLLSNLGIIVSNDLQTVSRQAP